MRLLVFIAFFTALAGCSTDDRSQVSRGQEEAAPEVMATPPSSTSTTIAATVTEGRTFVDVYSPLGYQVTVVVDTCAIGVRSDICEGPAQITLSEPQGSLNQTFRSNYSMFSPTGGLIGRVNRRGAVEFDDFDFDGHADLAVVNGKSGGYGALQYDIYTFDASSRRFVANRALTDLGLMSLGLLEPDPVAKTLTVYQRSGAFWGFEFVYRFANGTPTQIRRMTYDYDDRHPDTTIVTVEDLTDAGWISRTETKPRSR